MTQIIHLKHGGLGLINSAHKKVQLMLTVSLVMSHFNYLQIDSLDNLSSSSSSTVSAGLGCGAVLSVSLETSFPGHLLHWEDSEVFPG